MQYISGLREKGTLAVFVNHSIYHAYSICNRFVVIIHGAKIHDILKVKTTDEDLTQMVIHL